MHDTVKDTHWHEPKAGQNAGFGDFRRPKLPYDRFMEDEGVPVYRGIGARCVKELPMRVWQRLGGRGSYIQLYGTEGLWGMYVVEVPPRAALNIERHIYEKIVFVVEGRGSTEVWQDGQTRRHVFEWQKGSLFSIPLNALHRIVNASSGPATLLCGTSAPNIINAELPLDNRRSPGYRRIEPMMTGNRFYQFIGQYETGRYSKAHKHHSTAVLICLKGRGYTYTWPDALGPSPWRDGKSDKVLRQDYEYGGIVSAAPMSGDWFHQHFGVAKEGLRVLAWHGPNNHPALKAGRPGEALKDIWAVDLDKGGAAIPYHLEDPALRREYEEVLARDGLVSRMEPRFYQPAGAAEADAIGGF